MTQAHRDPAPVPGVFLAKTTSQSEDSLASDVVDLLREGVRGGTDCEVGGVEETRHTTREQDEMRIAEREFMNALAFRVRERLPWASGRHGLRVSDLDDRETGRRGWTFAIRDTDGRPFEVSMTYHEVAEVAERQRNATMSNFFATLDAVIARLEQARMRYFVRRDGSS